MISLVQMIPIHRWYTGNIVCLYGRGRKWPPPTDLAPRPYNSVRTNVLNCDFVYVQCLFMCLPQHRDVDNRF